MDLSQFFVHSATVETFTGSGPLGDVYAAPVTVAGFLDDGVVREVGPGGAEVQAARTKFYCALEDAALFAAESRVTVNGRLTQVNYVRRRDGGSLPLPSHTEVDLR